MELEILLEGDALKVVRAQRLVVARWTNVASAPDLSRLEAVTLRCTREEPQLVYVSMADDRVPPMDADAQRRAVKAASVIFKSVAEAHVVLEGNSLRAAAERTVVRGMVLAGRVGQRVFGLDVASFARKVTVHDSARAALEVAARQAGLSFDALRTALTLARML